MPQEPGTIFRQPPPQSDGLTATRDFYHLRDSQDRTVARLDATGALMGDSNPYTAATTLLARIAAAAATPGLSALNRAVVVVPGGEHRFIAQRNPLPALDHSTDFVDLVAAYPGGPLLTQDTAVINGASPGPVIRARANANILGLRVQTSWGVISPTVFGMPNQWSLNVGHNWPGTSAGPPSTDFAAAKAGMVPAVFDRADNVRNAGNGNQAGSIWNTLLMDPTGTTAATDSVMWSKPIGYAPVTPVTAQVALASAANSGAAAPAVNDVFTMSWLDAAGTAIVTCAVTFADQTAGGAVSATASVKITSNQDATGVTHAAFFTKDATGAALQWLLSVRLNPATQMATMQLGHDGNSADSGDGVRAYEFEDVVSGMNGNVTGTTGTGIKYSGVPYRVEIRYHNASATGQLLLSWLHFSDNGYVLLGDSVAQWMHYGACEQSTTSQVLNGAKNFPFVAKFVGGIAQQGAADSLINHYDKRTYKQGYRRCIIHIGINDYQTTGSANQASVEASMTTMFADLATQMDHVIICTLPPRGIGIATRDAATQAAVAHTNAFIFAQAAALNGTGPCVFDVYDAHYDMTGNGSLSDAYPDATNYSSDGVHPDKGFQRTVRGCAGFVQQRSLVA